MSVVNCKVKYIRPQYNDLQEWMDDDNNVYIGRAGVVFIDNARFPKQSSIFANPFKMGRDGTRTEVLEKYKVYIHEKIKNPEFAAQLYALRGKNLGCWCAPDPCHGDVLLELITNM